jgi:hypothetical protein
MSKGPRENWKVFLDTAKSIFQDMLTGRDEQVCTPLVEQERKRMRLKMSYSSLLEPNCIYASEMNRILVGPRVAGIGLRSLMQGLDGLINDGVDMRTCNTTDSPMDL